VRGERRFVPRVAPIEREASRAIAGPSDGFCLRAPLHGRIEALAFEPSARREPGPGQLEIEVRATGLNFKDVMFCLGLMRPDHTAERAGLGLEVAGIVSRVGAGVERFAPGDRVAGICFDGIARFAISTGPCAFHIPERLSFAEAASLPACMYTAYVGLVRRAQLERGDTVLIHSAAGGVGHAAIQVASLCGARIFATAGTEAKRDYLRSLGIEQVMDSRSLEFAREVLAATGGYGVDVVLNSRARLGAAVLRAFAAR
jgi:NADPH:quinone reductase-like Zn-dependent oxidoreductase